MQSLCGRLHRGAHGQGSQTLPRAVGTCSAMMVTCHGASSPAPSTARGTAEASAQPKLLTEAAAHPVWDSRQRLEPFTAPGAGRRSRLQEDLCHQVKALQEEASKLFSIRDDEKETKWIFSETLHIEEEPQGRQSLCPSAWERQTPTMAKAGSLWLPAAVARLLFPL